MKVKTKEKVYFKGIWYRPGDELPKEYKDEKEAPKKKSEAK